MTIRTTGTQAIKALAMLSVLGGCGADDGGMSDTSDWQFPGWAGKSDDVGAGLTSTRDPVVLAFDGYNHVADAPVGRNCVLPEPGELAFASFRAGGDSFETEFTYIDTREQLERTMGLDAAAGIKLGPLGGGGSLGISKEYKSSDKSLAILLRTRQLYTVVNQDRHNITDDAMDVLRSDAEQFVRECGTGYVAGVAYGAELNLLIQIDASTLDEFKSVKTKLEAEGIKAGPATINASLGTAFSRALANENVEVSVNVEARGFVPTVDIGAIGSLDEGGFMVAAAAQSDLQDSVANDKCNDAGDDGPGTCASGPAKGYIANGARAAVPMGVLHQPFQRAANFPGDLAVVEALLEVDRAASEAVATLNDYAELYRAMVGIHNDEVGGMLSSDAPYEYNFYDTSNLPLQGSTFQAVQEHAATWASAYEPDNGTEVEKLADAVADCWSRAQFGDFSDCQVRPRDTVAGAEIMETMAEYGDARLRQVYYTFDVTALNHGPADDACPSGWRPPNAAEASRVWFAVERNPDMPPCTDVDDILQGDCGVWYDDDGIECQEEEGAWIEKGSDGAFRTGCHEDAILSDDPELIALCVPTSGVYGANIPDLPTE